jgi:ornithine carbamoyltransferase
MSTKISEEQINASDTLITKRQKNIQSGYSRSLLTLFDITPEEFTRVIDGGIKVKNSPDAYRQLLSHKAVAIIFQKTSTRTRMSLERGIAEMGGQCIYIDWGTSNFVLADLQDEIKVVSRYADLVVARVYRHRDLEIMRQYSEVPIINGLSELCHPCQGLADFMTIKEYFGSLKGLKIAYIGDGNNVCNSLIAGAALAGVKISVASPLNYHPNKEIVEAAEKLSLGSVHLTQRPEEAVSGADVIYTDTWISMGSESEKVERLKVFVDYQVNKELVSQAPLHALIMHCLPAHREYEITSDVIDSKNSIVFDQAENRKHVQKYLIGRRLELL